MKNNKKDKETSPLDQVEVKGFATFDAASGNAKFGRAQDIYSWLLDTDYGGRSFFARRMHSPSNIRTNISKN